MEILADNFAENVAFMIKSVKTADFIEIETKSSGEMIDNETSDSAENRYQKLRKFVVEMSAFQIGLTTYKWDSEISCYTPRPFIVQVWPHSDLLPNQVKRFPVKHTRKLRQDGFDFNKLLNLGVNYQRLSDIGRVKAAIDRRIAGESESLIRDEGELELTCYQLSKASSARLPELVKSVANFV